MNHLIYSAFKKIKKNIFQNAYPVYSSHYGDGFSDIHFLIMDESCVGDFELSENLDYEINKHNRNHNGLIIFHNRFLDFDISES